MNKFNFSSDEYKKLVLDIYNLIIAEYDRDVTLTEERYQKLVTMYEFVRLLRGEAFVELHEPVGDFQNNLYRMEDEIETKLSQMKVN